eukprot:COSAG04_NODE_23501_length_337_cov_0.873950_1_plen_29_part_10
MFVFIIIIILALCGSLPSEAATETDESLS